MIYIIISSTENIINEIFDDTEKRLSENELVTVRDNVSGQIIENQINMKNRYDKTRKIAHSYKIGDLVRIERNYSEKG